jgi:hypothetical protein
MVYPRLRLGLRICICSILIVGTSAHAEPPVTDASPTATESAPSATPNAVPAPPVQVAPAPSLPLNTDPKLAFQQGVTLLQGKRPEQALANFKFALEKASDDPVVLTNAGIAAFDAGKKGWAVAFLRHAISVGSSPRETRRALDFALSQLETKEIPHDTLLWEAFRDNLLFGVSLPNLLFLLAACLLFFGIIWLRFMVARRRALANEEALPSLNILHVTSALLLFLGSGAVWAKVVDLSQVRATVVADKTTAATSPSREAPSLFDLFAGLEVIVQRSQNGWFQVQYPGGPTGWVANSDLYVTQSRNLLPADQPTEHGDQP